MMLRLFRDIESIRRTVDFPPKSAFYSQLKQEHVSNEEYDYSKQIYDYHLKLPVGHPEKWNNFSDYLKFYNLLDVGPLVEALQTCFRKFKEYFNVDPGKLLFKLHYLN